MLFTADGYFEVAIESWPEWDLNPRPLHFGKKICSILKFVEMK